VSENPVTDFPLPVTVSVPASTANLGAGFDVLALALSLRNTVTFTDLGEGEGVEVAVAGEGQGRVPLDGRNLVARSAERVFDLAGRRPRGRLRIHCANRIPLGSGMGSSAATILGGLAAANALVGAGLDHDALLRLACAIEGHPDNAAAAVLGGLVIVSAAEGDLVARRVPMPPARVVIALPALRLSTAQARRVLPDSVPRADAVFNLGHAVFTVQALASGDAALLGWAVADRLHQPYRQPLIPGYAEVEAAARGQGALAVALSGAGPSLIAFAAERHAEIALAMQSAFQARGLATRTFVLDVDFDGLTVTTG
jgi:homoserine kinase